MIDLATIAPQSGRFAGRVQGEASRPAPSKEKLLMAKPANMTFETLGRNVQGAYDASAKQLHLIIDVSDRALAAAPPSSTGKTRTVGSTGGFKPLGPVSLSLNVNAKGNGQPPVAGA